MKNYIYTLLNFKVYTTRNIKVTWSLRVIFKYIDLIFFTMNYGVHLITTITTIEYKLFVIHGLCHNERDIRNEDAQSVYQYISRSSSLSRPEFFLTSLP